MRLEAILDLIDELEADEIEGQLDVLNQMRALLGEPFPLWPQDVLDCVATVVSPSAYNPASQTYKGLDKRVMHTLAVWKDKYSPWNAAQEEYASAILCAAITKAGLEAGENRRKLYGFIHSNIGYATNHEMVHAGFQKRRAPLVGVDVAALVAA